MRLAILPKRVYNWEKEMMPWEKGEGGHAEL